jgi:hypothetical protein
VEFFEEESLVENWKGWVDDAEVEFYEVVSTALDEGLNSIDFLCVLVNSRIVC